MAESMIGTLFTHEILIVLLWIALAIFAAVAIQSKNIRSFQFQISIFIMIWIAGEMADVLQGFGLFSIFGGALGMQLHLASMIFFSAMIWLRFLYAVRKHKQIVDKPPEGYFE